MTLADFPDIELAVCDLLQSAVAGLTAGTETPADFDGLLPFARVLRHGGSDDLHTDTARITIDSFTDASTSTARADAHGIAEQIRQALIFPGGKRVDGVVLDLISTDQAPVEVPWNANNSPRRFVAAYSITARR